MDPFRSLRYQAENWRKAQVPQTFGKTAPHQLTPACSQHKPSLIVSPAASRGYSCQTQHLGHASANKVSRVRLMFCFSHSSLSTQSHLNPTSGIAAIHNHGRLRPQRRPCAILAP